MIDLAQHIESLLLENDCVIIPGLGGFVAHHAPAEWVEDEHLFLPPSRKVGFNPQLKLNDGLLVQSYMSVYGTNFPEANKLVEKEIKQLIRLLHEEGKVDLSNVGELHCTIHGKYDFNPYDQKLATPSLYGLDSFEMHKLAERCPVPDSRPALRTEEEGDTNRTTVTQPIRRTGRSTHRTIRLHPYRWASIAAMIAVVFLSFFFAAPIENTEVPNKNYACLSPEQLFSETSIQQLTVTPVTVRKPGAASANKPSKAGQVAARQVSSAQQPEEATVTTASPATTQPETVAATSRKAQTEVARQTKRYHVIVASVGAEADADKMAKRLSDQGYAEASVIIGDGKVRVCLQSFDTEREAYRKVNQLRTTDSFPGAWVLKK